MASGSHRHFTSGCRLGSLGSHPSCDLLLPGSEHFKQPLPEAGDEPPEGLVLPLLLRLHGSLQRRRARLRPAVCHRLLASLATVRSRARRDRKGREHEQSPREPLGALPQLPLRRPPVGGAFAPLRGSQGRGQRHLDLCGRERHPEHPALRALPAVGDGPGLLADECEVCRGSVAKDGGLHVDPSGPCRWLLGMQRPLGPILPPLRHVPRAV
mmetsp:Transcript_65017/g.180315  ORF Transcript_65017/g.180315 Transcript_65017/m.180315 type:complete len:212 (+) Transcript_65017:1009-1644(+)